MRLGRFAVTAAAGGALLIVATAATLALLRLRAPDPAPVVNVHVPAELLVSEGQPPAIPLPASGSLTVAQPGAGRLADLAGANVRPIGSVAKAMTAFVVLTAHPLTPGAEGPTLTMTATDVTLYREAVAAQGSALFVSEGERLTERQLLLALLLPSANNIAETLARWVGGTRQDFIAMLNERAAALEMGDTHFDDPSGVSDATVSTTHDLVRLAS
ncbi:MAG TPA: D-alanyl-D-alanine carboxypeptidase, partial [Candidatus Dormibacteraeota bacterium]|nr:D-alanyl-D-alanine carboxypeptidase [Candidatus Dormibacteraeota bacterium]